MRWDETGLLARPTTPGERFGPYRMVSFDGCSSLRVPDSERNQAWLGRTSCHGYPTLELNDADRDRHPGLVGAVFGPPAKGRRKGFTEADYARLLDAAHQQLGGPVVLVWDNLNTHVSRTMHELIAARSWLTIYQLPPYAPELNPVEGVWSHLKRSLANLTKHSLDQLTALVKTRLKRMPPRSRSRASWPRPGSTSNCRNPSR
nr:transposase [Streptomyces yerevanensis]